MNTDTNPRPSIDNATNVEINMLDEMLNMFPPGYKFLPDDAELIMYYLQPKIAGHPTFPGRIYDADVYKYPPEVLNGISFFMHCYIYHFLFFSLV